MEEKCGIFLLGCWWQVYCTNENWIKYQGADKSLARPTSRCILFDD